MTRRNEYELHEFTVEGSGEFPMDMLRFDNCWPKNESPDSANVALNYGPASDPPKLRRVTLLTRYRHAPTVRRWESFTWKVVS